MDRIDDAGVPVAALLEHVALHVVQRQRLAGRLPLIIGGPAFDGRIVGHGEGPLVRFARDSSTTFTSHARLVGRHEDKAHVGVVAQRLLGADRGDDVPRVRDAPANRETSWFQGLSAGKTCRAGTMRSASGVLNMTGW